MKIVLIVKLILTTMHYFNTPTTNITAMPAIAHHDLPYSNLTDECFTNELTQENTTDSEININNALESINNPEHVDYSTLGNIDPDINFFTEMNSMICNYYTEFEFNQCFPNINNFSIFNLNVRSLPKTSIKFVISWKDCNTIFLFYLSPKLGFVTTITQYTILLVILMYTSLDAKTKWVVVYQCSLTAELIFYLERILK